MPDREKESAAFRALKSLIEQTEPRADAEAIARKLTASQNRISRVFEMAAEDISAQTGLGKTAANAIDMIDELSRYAGIEAFGANPVLGTPEQAGGYFMALCRGRHVEHCYIACLDEHRRLISCRLMGKGTLNAAEVYVRNIAQAALRCQASYVYMAHNHPGGGLVPSNADRALTLQAMQALELIGVTLLDHLIVTNNAYTGILSGEQK